MDSFYQITFHDAFRAGEAMADAFVDDPVWRKLFEGESDLSRKYQAFFEVPIRICLKYGKVYAMYEHFGFRLIKKIMLENIGLPMWEMVRESQGSGSEGIRSVTSNK